MFLKYCIRTTIAWNSAFTKRNKWTGLLHHTAAHYLAAQATLCGQNYFNTSVPSQNVYGILFINKNVSVCDTPDVISCLFFIKSKMSIALFTGTIYTFSSEAKA